MKDFLLIANKNCITYKEFFPYIKDRKVNIGYTHPGDFDQPEEDTYKSMQGLTRWFTTLSTSSKPPLVLTATYDPEKYKHYDNYDAINVDKVKDIPWDYDGVIGVPITILDHNLDNVEIDGLFGNFKETDCNETTGFVCGDDVSAYNLPGTQNGPVIITSTGPEAKYKRVLIKKNFEIDGCLYGDHTIIDGAYIKGHTPEIDGKHLYTRVLIRRKQL